MKSEGKGLYVELGEYGRSVVGLYLGGGVEV